MNSWEIERLKFHDSVECNTVSLANSFEEILDFDSFLCLNTFSNLQHRFWFFLTPFCFERFNAFMQSIRMKKHFWLVEFAIYSNYYLIRICCLFHCSIFLNSSHFMIFYYFYSFMGSFNQKQFSTTLMHILNLRLHWKTLQISYLLNECTLPFKTTKFILVKRWKHSVSSVSQQNRFMTRKPKPTILFYVATVKWEVLRLKSQN